MLMMRKLCRSYETFTACMDPIKLKCDMWVDIVFKILDNTVSVWCDQGNLKELNKHADCLAKIGIKEKALPCIVAYKRDLMRPVGNKANVCQGAVNCVDCILKPVSSTCGVEAARWQHKPYIHLLKPMFDVIGCSISDADNSINGSNGGRAEL
ncbi:hypothetical protein LSAT2_014272 [Lamellibrachia satsuma]|nr:hypothetical protein LSAT2_014272 [Lamellibrachia satsuma]